MDLYCKALFVQAPSTLLPPPPLRLSSIALFSGRIFHPSSSSYALFHCSLLRTNFSSQLFSLTTGLISTNRNTAIPTATAMELQKQCRNTLSSRCGERGRVDTVLRYCYCGSIAVAVGIAALRFVEMSPVARLKTAGGKRK